MGKPNRSAEKRQARHKRRGKRSQFDRRERLTRSNPNRRKTTEATVPLCGRLASMASSIVGVLDVRQAVRFRIILAGMMIASGTRTASSWFKAAGVKDDWDGFYGCLISVGQRTKNVASQVLELTVKKLLPGCNGVIKLAIDDSPTQRYGREVQGAGVHHNPTRGPADGKFLYGHNWVTMAWLAEHPLWGVMALPILSMLYVRAIDVPKLPPEYAWKFKTKLQLAVDMVLWFVSQLHTLGVSVKLWVVADGAYGNEVFIKPLLKEGVVVFSRLRQDAELFDLPPERKPRQPGKKAKRGRPPTYGKNRISLSKRAGNKRGWQTMTFSKRGQQSQCEYQEFLATSKMVGGRIRVVIVRHSAKSWSPYFCTDPTVTAQEIVEMISQRWAIEEQFHDVKEVWGADEQQVRNVWSNIGCWHLNGWMFTMVELACWDMSKEELVDRSGRSWDNASRRPSHADRRRALSQEMLRKQFLNDQPATPDTQKFTQAIELLLSLSA